MSDKDRHVFRSEHDSLFLRILRVPNGGNYIAAIGQKHASGFHDTKAIHVLTIPKMRALRDALNALDLGDGGTKP